MLLRSCAAIARWGVLHGLHSSRGASPGRSAETQCPGPMACGACSTLHQIITTSGLLRPNIQHLPKKLSGSCTYCTVPLGHIHPGGHNLKFTPSVDTRCLNYYSLIYSTKMYCTPLAADHVIRCQEVLGSQGPALLGGCPLRSPAYKLILHKLPGKGCPWERLVRKRRWNSLRSLS